MVELSKETLSLFADLIGDLRNCPDHGPAAQAVQFFNSKVKDMEVSVPVTDWSKPFSWTSNGTWFRDELLGPLGEFNKHPCICAVSKLPDGRTRIKEVISLVPNGGCSSYSRVKRFFKGITDEENTERANSLITVLVDEYARLSWEELGRQQKLKAEQKQREAERKALLDSLSVESETNKSGYIGYRRYSETTLCFFTPVTEERAVEVFKALDYRMEARHIPAPIEQEEITLTTMDNMIWVRKWIEEYYD